MITYRRTPLATFILHGRSTPPAVMKRMGTTWGARMSRRAATQDQAVPMDGVSPSDETNQVSREGV